MARLIYRLEDDNGVGPWTNCHNNVDRSAGEGMVFGTHSLNSIDWWVTLDSPINLRKCKISVYKANRLKKHPFAFNWNNKSNRRKLIKAAEYKQEKIDFREVIFNPSKSVRVARLPLNVIGINT